MTALKEIWEEIEKRTSSPFFGSFVLSWLIFNYKVPVGMLFIKQSELPKEYSSYFDLIAKHSDVINFGVPLVCAFIYTFGYPYFRDFVTVHLTKIEIKTDKKLLTESETGMMPMARYLLLKAELKAQKNEIEVLGLEERKFKDDLGISEQKVMDLERIIEETREQNDQRIRERDEYHGQELIAIKRSHENAVESVRHEIQREREQMKDEKSTLEEINLKLLQRTSALEIQNKQLSSSIEQLKLDHQQQLASEKLTNEDNLSDIKRTHNAQLEETRHTTSKTISELMAANDQKQRIIEELNSELKESRLFHEKESRSFIDQINNLTTENINLLNKIELLEQTERHRKAELDEATIIVESFSHAEKRMLEAFQKLWQELGEITRSIEAYQENYPHEPRVSSFTANLSRIVKNMRDVNIDFI